MGLFNTKIAPYGLADIGGTLDRVASKFGGLSQSPQRRGRQFAGEYLATISSAEALTRSVSNDENRARVNDAYRRWLARYKKSATEYLAQASNTASWAVTGRGGINVRRYNKQQDRYDKRMRAYAEAADFRKVIMRAAALQSIRSTDSDAVSRLKSKIEAMEAKRERMKAVNALLKREGPRTVMGRKIKTDEDEIAFLMNVVGRKESEAKALQKASRGAWSKDGGFSDATIGRTGGLWHARFEISNLGQRIRQNKLRLKQIEIEQKQETPEDLLFKHPLFGSGTIEQDDDAGRIRILFDAKPNAESRTKLKSSGWRWAPSVGAWQRQTTDNARSSLYRLLGVKFGIA